MSKRNKQAQRGNRPSAVRPHAANAPATNIQLARDRLCCALFVWQAEAPLPVPDTQPHAGLLIDKGCGEWTEDAFKAPFIKKISNLQFDGDHPYLKAYQCWQAITAPLSPPRRFYQHCAKIEGRLYIGIERNNALETGITTHRVWGAPLIPGSAVKGVCRAHAHDIGLRADIVHWLFGNDHSEANAEKQDVGQIIFHDAWWVPASGPEGKEAKPFAQEIVTPHHTEYYKGQGAPATDFDSPFPAPQIATHGQFLFVLEAVNPAEEVLFGLAQQLLKETLSEHGIGAKGSSGYGYFSV